METRDDDSLDNGEFRHLVRCKFLTPDLITQILNEATLMARVLNFRNDPGIVDYRLALRQEFMDQGITMASLFYEESLRTRWSHERAAHALGAEVISTENAAKFSSAAKGESLEHAIQVISGFRCPSERYADIVVMRHPIEGSAKRAMKFCGVPLINAGDGIGEHPTQALLDIFAIQRRLGRIRDFKIGMFGDLLNSRVIHSDVYLVSKFPGVHIYLVSDPRFAIKPDLRQYLVKHNIWFTECTRPEGFPEVFTKVDVAVMTRVQKNRFNMDDPAEAALFRSIRGQQIVNRELADDMKPGAFILHPMPIETDSADGFPPEIMTEVDNHPNSFFFQQAGGGIPSRMAVIKILLENWGLIKRIAPPEKITA
ncbi:MAG: aspartate carbamoyltransferase [Patescibacteria group bacterium]